MRSTVSACRGCVWLVPLCPAVFSVTGDQAAEADSSSWFPTLWKDKDAAHFDNFLRKTKYDQLKGDSMMLWPSLKNGLKSRAKDEEHMQTIMHNLKNGPNLSEEEKNNMSCVISDILYGKDFSAQDRQNYLERHGCVQATPEALDLINSILRKPDKSKLGIVEIGVGFGQWARILVDSYNVDIVAFDNMMNLPLDPRVHNTKTVAYRKYFYQGKVRLGDANIFSNKDMIDRYKLTGRALMLIFPDPGPMAIECLKAYASCSEYNDTLVYVGEGRGGANANSLFFDELEGTNDRGEPKWQLQDTCKLKPFGAKGFERLFIFKKISGKQTAVSNSSCEVTES